MAYTKQNFEDGQVLTAEHLNKMEQGIEDVVNADAEKVSYIEQELTDDQKTQARTNIGAVKSWNELTSKPVVTEPSDTLTWDGNTDGLVTASSGVHYKVSDVVPALSDFENGLLIGSVYEGTENIGEGSFEDIGYGCIMCGWSLAFVVPESAVGVDLDGITFPEAGIYLIHDGGFYTSSLTIPGYTGFTKEKIAPSHLYQPDWEQTDESKPDFVKNKPFKDAFKPIVYEGEMVFTYEGVSAIARVTTEKSLTAGKRYTYYYDGQNYTCEAVDVATIYGISGQLVALGNLTEFGISSGEELPFEIVWADDIAAVILGFGPSATLAFALLDKTADYPGYVVLAEGEGYPDTVTLEDVIYDPGGGNRVVSNATPGLGAFANGFSLNVTLKGVGFNSDAGTVEKTLTQDDCTVSEDDNGVIISFTDEVGTFKVVWVYNEEDDSLVEYGYLFPKGIRMGNLTGNGGWVGNATSLTINNYPTKFEETEVKQIDEKYIPAIPVEKLPEALQFGTSYVDTLTWDGNVTGLVSNTAGTSFKVADVVPTKADFANGLTVTIGSESGSLDGATAQASFSDDGYASMLDDVVVIIPYDNYDAGNSGVFPEAGVYFWRIEGVGISLTVHGYTGFPSIKQIEEKYIPNSVKAAVILYSDDLGYLYTNSDTSDTTKRMTAAELKSVFMGSKSVYITLSSLAADEYLVPIFWAIREEGYGVVSAFEDGGVISFYTAEYTPATTEETT